MSDDDAKAAFPGSTWRAAAFPEPEQSLLDTLEAVYKDIHSHPELSMQEHRTAGIAADWLENLGYAVTRGVGGTGVVGVLANGDGATVLLRADMDALPMKETTGLSYASVATGVDESGSPSSVAHSCGHDMHVTWLLGATQVLAANRDRWQGTVIAVFQPAEETGEGADAMLADDLIARFPRPDVALGQHVVPAPAGSVAWTSGTTMSASDSLEVRLHGRGAHGSSPEHSVDPIVMAAATVMNLQAVRSREIGMQEAAVLTVGSLHAGNSDNVIPDEAVLRLNVRSFDEGVRLRVLAGIQRVVNAAAAAANAPRPPEVISLGSHPITHNDPVATARLVRSFVSQLGQDAVREMPPATASEDFGTFGTAWGVPSVFWFVGGTDPTAFEEATRAGTIAELPSNHNPAFAPVIHPTLEAGLQTMVIAAATWLALPPGRDSE